MVMENMWNKEVFYAKNFYFSPTGTEMLRGDANTMCLSTLENSCPFTSKCDSEGDLTTPASLSPPPLPRPSCDPTQSALAEFHVHVWVDWEKSFFAEMISSVVAMRCFCSNDRHPLSSPLFTERLSLKIESDIHLFIY
jgi:hypothetical protein